MRLLIATPFLESRGGLERVILKIAQHFDARIHCIRYNQENTFAEFADLDIEVAKPSALGSLPLGKRMATAVEAGRHFYDAELGDYDLINAHQTPSEWVRNKNAPVLWYCIHEDTPVLKKTPNGYEYCSIKSVKPGDNLFSFNKLKKSFTSKILKVRHRESSKLGILRLKNGRELTATYDHKFFVFTEGRFSVKRLADINPGDLIPIPRKIKASETKGKQFIDVRLALERQFSEHPYWSSRLFIDFSGRNIAIGNRKTVLIPARIKLTKEFARLLGYYASEGYIHFRHAQNLEDMQLGFSFGLHEEKTLVKDCASCIKAVFRVNPKIKKVPKRSEILVIMPNAHALFFLSLGCGSKARNKRVPDIIFNCSDSLKREFLMAYLHGDGHYEKKAKRWVCTSVGYGLINGLCYLLSMLGKQATIVRRRAHKFNDYASRLSHQMYSLRFSESGYSRYKSEDDLVYVPVKEIIRLNLTARVVDVEVSGNHSLLAGDCIYTHNCHTPNREAFDLYEWRMRRRNPISKAMFWASIQAFKHFEFKTVPNIEHIFTNSRNSQGRIKKYLNVESEVLHPAVEHEKFCSRGYERFFFYPSRIAPEKELEYAIEAFRIFSRDAPGWKLVLAGSVSDRPEHQDYLKKIRSMCDENITIKTNLTNEELMDYYSRCSAVLYTPVNEDFGIVPLEAMASSKPCLARNEGGPKETISDGLDGFLAESPGQMAEKMLWLSENPEQFALMGRAGRDKVKQKFTWDIFLRRFEDKAKEIVERQSR